MDNSIRLWIALAVLAAMMSSALAQDVEYSETFSPNNQFTANWCTDGDDIRFQLIAEGTGWLAIGFSNNQSMPDSDVIMLTGEGVAQDAFANSRSAPIPDESQDITIISSSEVDGVTTVEFSRAISTGDEADLSLDEDRFLVWAYQATSDLFFARHSDRGFSADMMNLSSAGACQGNSAFNNDFNSDGTIDVTDINLLLGEVKSGANNTSFDVNSDELVNQADIANYIVSAFNSYVGDSNLDGEFSSSDFVTVFTAGEYEDEIPNNSEWQDGDWNGDGEFSTTDLVFAFQEQGFEQGPRAVAAATVPEPSSYAILMSLVAIGCCMCRRWLA